MRTAADWLDEYGSSHRHPANEALHWICVPVIEWCVVGLLWLTPFPAAIRTPYPVINWASIALLAAVLYYLSLSRTLALGSFVLLVAMLASVTWLGSRAPDLLLQLAIGLFLLAWIGQFVGHAIEGKRPSFFKDLQFLMIGPLWLLSRLYRRMGLRQ